MRIIYDMLKEVAEGTVGINYYNHAPEAYAAAIPGEFPRIWTYHADPDDTVHKNHSVTTAYNVILEISDIAQLSDKTETLEQARDRVNKLWLKFINRLSKDPRNMLPIGKVKRIEILHKFSHNIVGYICTFTITPLDPPEYQCP